jgi:XTP/dITP diphosphohydrolase
MNTAKRAPTPIYLASGNAHKVEEFQQLVDGSALEVAILSARAAGGMPPVEEDTGTFFGNARKKAQALFNVLPERCWVLADDSGLCVDALGGGPGVESAYFAGPAGDARANLEKLVRVMGEVPEGDRRAYFVCVLVLIDPEGGEQVFEGRCEGCLAREPRGGGGFGYDPLFIPTGHSATIAELPPEVKHALSHRGQAWGRLAEWWRNRLNRD